MKKILLTAITCVALAQLSFSQDIDTRLLVKYGKQELVKLQKNKPDEYAYLVKVAEHGMFICDIPAEKEQSIVFDGEVTINPTEKHTVFSIGKNVTERYQYYRIANTNQMVVIYPKFYIQQKK